MTQKSEFVWQSKPRSNISLAAPLLKLDSRAGESNAAYNEDAELVLQARAGDMGSWEALWRKYSAYFLRHAERANGCDPEDTLQQAYELAWIKLSDLRCPASFRPWFLQLLYREANRVRKKFQKVGTESLEDHSYLLETMFIDPHYANEADLNGMLGLLDASAKVLAQPFARVGLFMLEHFRQEQEFPAIRLIALKLPCSKGVAERSRATVLQVFRRHLRECL